MVANDLAVAVAGDNSLGMEFDNESIIMVIGVGGAGGNAVNHMQKMGIKCAVQETREDMGLTDCDSDNICSGNCAGCDIDHTEATKHK